MRYKGAGNVGENFRHVERLRKETLNLPCTEHGELVLIGKLVHAEDRDDVLKVLVALEHELDATCNR